MVITAKDTAKQLYRSVFAILLADTDLSSLLEVTDPNIPKIYQSFIDFQTAKELKFDQWVSFHTVSDTPFAIEQTQDVHDVTLDVNIWYRGPGSDPADDIEKRLRELLDDADLNSPTLFSWYCHFDGYSKIYEPLPQLWHVVSTYRIMCMAIAS